VIVALNTGMRIGEILNLRYDQIDLASGVIIVEHTKNGKIRKIPINSKLHDLLDNAKMIGNFVFGNGINPYGSIKKGFHAAIRRAGIPHLRFHDLRHTFATRLVSNGVDLATVKELLGHSTITMTMRYTHPTPEHKIQAVESLVSNKKWTTDGHQEKPVPSTISISNEISTLRP
jgi:integrase